MGLRTFIVRQRRRIVQGLKLNQLREGDKAVDWIETELETLIPLLERAETLSYTLMPLSERGEALSDQNDWTNIIHKAEILIQTYKKKVIKRNAAKHKKPINSMKVRVFTKKLYGIRGEIIEAREKLSEYLRTGRLLSSHTAAETQGGSIPLYLRRCLHYLVLFLEDFKVPPRRLMALWVAEGLVRSNKNDSKSVQQIAQGYLDELIDRGLIHVERDQRGTVETCWIDATRRKELLEEAKRVHFLQDRDGKILRLVDHNGDACASFINIDRYATRIPRSERNYQKVISFLSFNTQEGEKHGEDVGDFLSECISDDYFLWLNVLDLERVFRPKLPDTLGKLMALKYLGLRGTIVEKLPSAVKKLLNLQVLDVEGTNISELPRSLWRMEYLQHLYLNEEHCTKFPEPPSKVTLTALQTLWGAFVNEDTRVENGLDRLLNIRKLGLLCRWKTTEMPSNQLKAIQAWISNLKYLESLRLASYIGNEASDLHLTSLETNECLSKVYLIGKLNPDILCTFPHSLTDITLSGSQLNLDPMGFLGILPNLIILRLLGRSVVGIDELYCTRGGFPRLKVLCIWELNSLNRFEAEEESLPCLEELEIRSCQNLERLPHRLQHLQNLQIRLTNTPAGFVEHA